MNRITPVLLLAALLAADCGREMPRPSSKLRVAPQKDVRLSKRPQTREKRQTKQQRRPPRVGEERTAKTGRRGASRGKRKVMPLTQERPFEIVYLDGLFNDHMVLQRDKKVPVWGITQPGVEVTVEFSGQKKTVKGGESGEWMIHLDPMPANFKGQTLIVSGGGHTVEVKDVLVGEVWLCSGQSNMAMTVQKSADFVKEAAAAAMLSRIRHVTIPTTRGRNSLSVKVDWIVCDDKTVGRFSATAFFFGREIHRELKVPVGLINSSVGGTPIERWTGPKNAGDLYQAKIAPLVPYAIRGAIWYQGESNTRGKDPAAYAGKLAGLIRGWREVWGQGDFPFYFVQLPDFRAPQEKPVEDTGWVLNREAMVKVLANPNTGMAVTLGLGDARDIHPKQKQGVGRRLSLWALAETYGRKIVYSGPLYRSMRQRGGKITLSFDHVGGGLAAKSGGKLEGFAIAGADRRFVWADARIKGKTVVVSSGKVLKPAAVRYAWASNPKFSLVNKAGLVASPFRTDDWPVKIAPPPARKKRKRQKK